MTDETPLTDAEIEEMREKAKNALIAHALLYRDDEVCSGFRIPVPGTNLVLSLWPKEGEK